MNATLIVDYFLQCLETRISLEESWQMVNEFVSRPIFPEQERTLGLALVARMVRQLEQKGGK